MRSTRSASASIQRVVKPKRWSSRSVARLKSRTRILVLLFHDEPTKPASSALHQSSPLFRRRPELPVKLFIVLAIRLRHVLITLVLDCVGTCNHENLGCTACESMPVP